MRPTMHMRPTIGLQLLAVIALGVSGCDFFHELQSLPEAGEDTGDSGTGTGESGGTGETGETGSDGPCDVLDESCPNQDTLRSCDPETGELVTYDCAVLCGENLLNFTCLPSADFTHGCWCVEPGDIKIDACWELEACMLNCGGGPESDCTNECFTRTDAQTIRLLGTLYSCADRACDEICVASPQDCASCLQAAQAGLYGDCGVERQVCDADSNGEPSWP